MPPSQGPPASVHQRRQQQRQDLVRLAHDAPPAPSLGPTGCLALILVPIGLLLLTVHSAPGMAVLTLGAVA
ncbi:MAG: hypothetical protein ACKO22_02090 [Cyanobium sp.]